MKSVTSSRVFTAKARRFGCRAAALVLVCAALVCAFPAIRVKAAADTRPYIGDRYGITREDIVRWLQSHENDNYYIGTPYGFLAYTAPNGDPTCTINPGYSTNGQPLMNCAGFVAHVVYKCGLDVAKWNGYLAANYPALYNRQNYNLASADMWYLHVTGDTTGFQGNKELTGGFRYYSFPSLTEALKSGRMRKGDLFIFWPKEGYAKDREFQDSHIGVYWGDTVGENKFWHMLWPYCKIDAIYTFKGPYDFIVIPFSEDADSGTLTVTQKNARGEALYGAKFTVTNDKTGDTYQLGPTRGDGSASIFLPVGEYTVRQSVYPTGYAFGYESSWTVKIEKKKTVSINANCDLPAGTLEIKQTDESGRGVAGTVFTAVRQSDGRAVDSAPTDSSGAVKVNLAPGKYTVTQTQIKPSYIASGEKSWTVTVESYKSVSIAAKATAARGSIGVKVVDAEGEGVPGVYFEVRDTQDPDEEPVFELVTDINGLATYGLENGKHTLDYGKVYYVHFVKTAWDEYVGIGGDFRVPIEGGETVWLGGGELTLAKKSAITLSDEIPEGEYAIFKDADCTERATVPSDDFYYEVLAGITRGEELVIGEGTYYLRLDEDLTNAHEATTVTYKVKTKAGQTVAVSAEGAVTVHFLRHTFEKNGETRRDARGSLMRFCDGCGEFILFGDVNADGFLNARDVTVMMRYLAGMSVDIDTSVWDVNPDGKFNAKDVTALMKQMVG